MCDNALPVWRGEGTIQDEIGGKRRSKAKRAARGRSMKKKSTQSRGGVKGGFPLAGSRGGAPCGVWGNAPTVPRATSMPNALNKGAGSEASLPVTLRSRRSAPKLLYPTSMQCRAKWARPDCLTSDHSSSFPQAGVSPLQRRRGGNENRRSLRSPPRPLRSGHSPHLIFSRSKGNADDSPCRNASTYKEVLPCP